MHQETLRHTAFPLETSTNFCRLIAGYWFCPVYQGADGLSYGILSPNAFRLSPSGAALIPWSDQAPPVSAMTLADGRVLSLDEENGILVLTEKSQSGSTIVLPLPYSGESTPLFRIGLGPDGLVYGSATMPSDLVQIDPATGVQHYIGTLGPGEAYSMMSHSSQLLLGTYADDHPHSPYTTQVSLSAPHPGRRSHIFPFPTITIPGARSPWPPHQTHSLYGGRGGYGSPTGPLLSWNPSVAAPRNSMWSEPERGLAGHFG